SGNGTVFQMSPEGAFANIFYFPADFSYGAYPYMGLTKGADTNLYGLTSLGGENNFGTVFRITRDGTFSELASFDGRSGANPQSRVVQASDGYLYGTTPAGGPYGAPNNSGFGAVYRLTFNGEISLD